MYKRQEQDSAFVCIKGHKADGHDHAKGALAKGAACIVCEQDLGLPNQIIVQCTRYVYAVMCSNFNGNPSRNLKLVGITGTNGKTTTTNLLKHILEHAGRKTGLIGTCLLYTSRCV